MTASLQNKMLTFFIYVFVFVLLREWLKPVIQLTDTDYMWLFLLFIGISFLLYLLGASWKIGIPLKVILIGWIIVYIYSEATFFSSDGLQFLGQALITNLEALLGRNWSGITDPFRTFLFYILLWMTAYLINYWIRVRKSLLLFFILTVLFVTILDTFSPYDGKVSIIITSLSGFIIMGLLYAKKLLEEHGIVKNGKFLFSAATSLFVLVAFSAGLAFLLPKAGPIWPDPVPFFTSSSLDANGRGIGTGGGLRTVGYGDNDEKLGGAFASDDTLVFHATVSSRQYWKVETKDTYTSKGWINSQEPPYDSIGFTSGSPIFQDIEPGPADTMEIANINMVNRFPFAVQPYGIKSIYSEDEDFFSLTMVNQQIGSTYEAASFPRSYDVEFSEPEYSLTALRNTSLNGIGQLGEDLDRYLQLPENLPQRVRDLAVQVTSSEDSIYEKAKRIERYFRQNGYSYNQNEAAIPTGDIDYVDQFLFDTKVGYCDNFSTSMVVMLRSIGVPARWVKGFAPGEEIERINDKKIYQITNNNAHSWVEAYLPEVGWMPFEPTIGFTNYANINYDVERQIDTSAPVEEAPDQAPERPEEATKQQAGTSKTFTQRMESVVDWVGNHKAVVIWSIVGMLVLALLGFHYRRKWISKILIPSYRARPKDWKTFEKMYHQLLKQLASYGYKREQGQTLMDFAKDVDESFGGSHMKRLTKEYERGFYGNNKKDLNFSSMRESWENLINQLSS